MLPTLENLLQGRFALHEHFVAHDDLVPTQCAENSFFDKSANVPKKASMRVLLEAANDELIVSQGCIGYVYLFMEKCGKV